MTIAAAIEQKRLIQYQKNLLQKMKEMFSDTMIKFEMMNAKTMESLQRLLEVNFGKDSKAKSEEVNAISNPYLENNAPKLIDPINIKREIENLELKISKFEAEVDIVLSEINAKTEIDIG